MFILVINPVTGVAKDIKSWEGPIIDAHSQIDTKTDLDGTIGMLQQAGVRKVILSTRFKQPSSDVITLEKRFPNIVIAAAKTKTTEFTRGNGDYKSVFDKELKLHEYHAMAEVIMWHAAKKNGAGQSIKEPDDPLLLPMIKAAKKEGWPFIAHVEFANIGWGKKSYMKKFENFLSANKDLPIGMIHMGQLRLDDVSRLLATHPNIFFITSHSNSLTARRSKQPWTRMFDGKVLKPEWQKLIEQYPDRFVLAFDNVFYFHWKKWFLPQVKLWRSALANLPEEVAHKLAHKNAERLWKLDPVN